MSRAKVAVLAVVLSAAVLSTFLLTSDASAASSS